MRLPKKKWTNLFSWFHPSLSREQADTCFCASSITWLGLTLDLLCIPRDWFLVSWWFFLRQEASHLWFPVLACRGRCDRLVSLRANANCYLRWQWAGVHGGSLVDTSPPHLIRSLQPLSNRSLRGNRLPSYNRHQTTDTHHMLRLLKTQTSLRAKFILLRVGALYSTSAAH